MFFVSGNLIRIVGEMGRPDASAALMSGCPFYRISDLDEAEKEIRMKAASAAEGAAAASVEGEGAAAAAAEQQQQQEGAAAAAVGASR